MKFEVLKTSVGEWLKGTGPESDIVMSSRVRLARNLAQYPFVGRASETERSEIEDFLHSHLTKTSVGSRLEYTNLGGLGGSGASDVQNRVRGSP